MSTKPSTHRTPAVQCRICVVPTSPALVTELSPADTASAHILHAVRDILRQLVDDCAPGQQPVTEIVLLGSQAQDWRTEHRGSLRAWGANSIQLADGYYLAELVMRYLCGDYEPLISASYSSFAELESHPVQPGTLVLLGIDGSAGLGPRAPLAELAHAPQADRWARWLLGDDESSTDAGSAPNTQLPALPRSQQLHDAGIWEPALWLELAQLNARGDLADMQLRHVDTSHGAARYIATGLLATRPASAGAESDVADPTAAE